MDVANVTDPGENADDEDVGAGDAVEAFVSGAVVPAFSETFWLLFAAPLRLLLLLLLRPQVMLFPLFSAIVVVGVAVLLLRLMLFVETCIFIELLL